ncbi:hypothetical protein [Natronoarchaeum rubrum]|uniref:hypothetical protein n=1 Tax=Natronoarchaeum rubrum TaxID=755311 RepID=UPI002112BEFB|nr:hypothetical protein [Natronoarchaeum rubrum]
MGLTYRTKLYASIGLMILGVAALTVGADIAPDPALGNSVAIGGGAVVTVAGVWGFRIAEKQNGFDERFLKISLRGAAISLWAFYWAVSVAGALDLGSGVATPVLDPLTWLMPVPFVVFFVTVSYYERIM